MTAAGRSSGEVVVTGLGLVTPAGIGVAENWKTIRSGMSTAATDPELAGAAVDFSCRVPDFNPVALLGRATAFRTDRFVQLALVAAREAVADAGLDPATWDGARVGVVLGNSLGGSVTFERQHRELIDNGVDDVSPLMVPMSMVNMVAGYVSIDCGARGPSLVTATACASGTTAIGIARDLLRSGACDVVLAGGTESALSPAVLAGLGRMGALSARADDPTTASRPFDIDRDGFVAAEGAGILVLERRADAVARSAPIQAALLGFGASADAHHITAPAPGGAGMELALRMALADGGLTPADIDHVNAHGTGTTRGDRFEARGVAEVFGKPVPVFAPLSRFGNLGAGSALMELACSVLALQNGQLPGTLNHANPDPACPVAVHTGSPRPITKPHAVKLSYTDLGQCAAVVVKKWQE